MFNRAIGALPILFTVILILFGCQQSDHFNIEQITSIELDTGRNEFVETIKKSSAVRLIARDMNETADITGDKEKLMTVLSNAGIVVNDNPGYEASSYPDYSIEYVIDNKIGQISVIDGKNLVLRAYNAGFTRFTSNDEVWKYCNRNIPPKEPKDTGDLTYLFLGSSMVVEHEIYKGEYPNKMNWVIRSLRESESVSGTGISAAKPEMVLNFNIDNTEYKVEVSQDGFTFMGKNYSKINILNEITSILSAG